MTQRPPFSESVGGTDEDAPPPPPQRTGPLALGNEIARLRQALDECRRTALRARARMETEPQSTSGALEHIALTAGAKTTDLIGPRAGRWA